MTSPKEKVLTQTQIDEGRELLCEFKCIMDDDFERGATTIAQALATAREEGRRDMRDEIVGKLQSKADASRMAPVRGLLKDCAQEFRNLPTNALESEVDDLDTRMKEAGMVPLSELLAGTQLDRWRVHTGVTDVQSFLEIAEKKHESFTKLFIQYEVGDKEPDELYEWVLAHKAVWGDVVFNLRAAIEKGKQ